MHAIRIDRDKPLAAEPHSGHNRYHPDIAPVVEIGEGEEIHWRRGMRWTARSSRGWSLAISPPLTPAPCTR